MSKAQAGRLGGLATVRKYGRKHMKQIGRIGGEKTWSLYFLAPVGQSHYAMVRKSDNVIISTTIPQWRM